MTRDRSAEMEAFKQAARAVPILEAYERCGFSLSTLRRGPSEYAGPCPACGGRDRFSLAPAKNVFNCRGAGGGDAIELAQHLTGQDFLDACELLSGEERPDRRVQDDREAADRRRAAADRLAEQRRRAEAEEAARQEGENRFRDLERARCLEIWRAGFAGEGTLPSAFDYLRARGLDPSRVEPRYLRTNPRLGYFHKPGPGAAVRIHVGPAMMAQFVRPSGDRWEPIGLHQTWFDLEAGPKFRPPLVDPETGEPLVTKKMRGTKAGGLLPLIGRWSHARRLVAGEGIETVLGFARFDGFRGDTFYCAAGDLGNLCGRARPESRIRHPTLTTVDRAGRRRAASVPGTDPDMDAVCLPVPDAIKELVLLGDGDSEPVLTRAALKRGAARHARAGRVVRSMFAPPGMDWADWRESEAA